MEELINPNSLDKDLNENIKKSDKYSFALNAVVDSSSEESSFPFVSNASSNFLSSFLSPQEKLITAKVISELDIVILFTKLQGISYIKYFKVSKDYTLKYNLEITSLHNIKQTEITEIKTIISSNCLNFQESKNTNIVYKITEKTLNLYFVDGYNEDRFIYFDYNSNKDLSLNDSFKKFTRTSECEITYLNELNCNSVLWNPKLSYPSLNLNTYNGGNKRKGVYSYLIAYSTEKGLPLTPYKSLTSPIHIFEKNQDNTNLGVEITVSDITEDNRYNYYTIVCIKTVKEQTSFYKVGTYPINQDIVLDGEENEINISFDEISKVFTYYKSSKFIKEQNNILFRASLKEHERFNLQQLANKIKLNWIKVKLKEGDYKKSKIANQFKGYLSDENYIFGIKFILENLDETDVFIIPNREKVISDQTLILNDDSDNIAQETWRVYNTASVTTTNSSVEYDPENPKIYQEGEFGYFESSEKYPNIPEIWGDLCNKPIRLHKFPDLTISNFHSTSDNFNDNLFIYPLGVKLSDEIDLQILLKEAVLEGLISEEQRKRIKGYKLVRGNRVGNKSIIAKGLLYDVWKYTQKDEDCDNGDTFYFPSYPFNDISEDDLIASTNDHYDYEKFELDQINPQKLTFENTGRYSFISPDTTFVKPSLGSHLKIESEEYGKAEGFFNNSESQAKQLLLTKKHFNVAIVLATWIGQSIKDPTVEAASGTASGIGQGIGGSLGSVVGLSSIGSALGGIVGGLVGTDLASGSLNHLIFKNSVIISEAEKILQLFKLSNEPINLHKQYQAIGKYLNTSVIPNNGNKIRKIETSGYLNPDYVSIQESDQVINFNNWGREESVYLQINKNLPNLVRDNSRIKLNTDTTEIPIYSEECFNWHIVTTNAQDNRFTLRGIDCRGEGFYIKEFKNDAYDQVICAKEILVTEADNLFGSVKVELGDLVITKQDSCGTPEIIGYEKKNCNCTSETRTSDISSYYGSIKENILNQYGNVYNVNWIDTHSDMKPLHKCLTEVVKPVNLVPIKLSTVKLEPSEISIITDIECISNIDKCELVVNWNDSNTFTRVCNSDGTTTITVGVNGNGNNMVEFSTDNINYFDATQGTNYYSYTTLSTGNCETIYFRVKGCNQARWGCSLSFNSSECEETETDPNPIPEEPNFVSRSIDPFTSLSPGTVAYSKHEKWPIQRTSHVVTLPDFLPIEGKLLRTATNPPYQFDNFEQSLFPSTNLIGTFIKNGGTYYMKPNGYTESTNDKYKYIDLFPDFILPNNKIVIQDAVFYDYKNSDKFLKKGSSHVSFNNVPQSKKVKFVGDAFVLNLGMPVAYAGGNYTYNGQVYATRDLAFNQWCIDVDATALLNSFIQNVGNYGYSYDIVQLNGEDYVNKWWTERWKLEACFKWWQNQNFNSQIMIWDVNMADISRIHWQGNPTPITYSNAPNIDNGFWPKFQATELHENLDILNCNVYVNTFENHNFIHHFLTEYLLNKAFLANKGWDKKVIMSFFSNVEIVDQYIKPKLINRQTSSGTNYTTETKPQTFMSAMQSAAVWALAITDGINLWDNPIFYIENPTDEYGQGWNVDLQQPFSNLLNNEAMYYYESRSNIDWFMSGIWAISQNRDIVDDTSTTWQFPKNPDVVASEGGLLIAYKKSGNNILILALNSWDKEGIEEHTIVIDNKSYIVHTFGQFTTVKRFDSSQATPPSQEGCVPNVEWNINQPAVCENGKSKVLLEVTGNCGLQVQFADSSKNWFNANLNTNGETLNAAYILLPATGNCEEVYFKVPSLNLESSFGCTTTLNNCTGGSVDPETIGCGTTEANPHECTNLSTNGTHHGYYDYQSNSALGIFASLKGEYKIYNNTWKNSEYLGLGTDGLRYVGYKEPYNGSAVVYTRTKAGCTEFADGHCNSPRNIEVVTIDHNLQKWGLNINQSHSGNVIDFDGIWLSNHLSSAGTSTSIYAFELLNTNQSNLQWRINSGVWNTVSKVGNISNFENLSNGGYSIPKDYVLELRTSDGLNSDKFICRSWTNKGHFTITTTMTRLRDNKVFVCTFVGEKALPSYIKYSNGSKINSVSNLGTSFKLDSLNSDEIVTFGFQETNKDWVNIKLLNKNN